MAHHTPPEERSPLKYNTRVQVVMGICGLQWIDFVVYPFEAMKDTRLAFDKEYFYHAYLKQTPVPSALSLWPSPEFGSVHCAI